MIYGMYLSAAGMVTSAYRQDVVANNIANSETIGFKRDLAMLQERPTKSDEVGLDQQTGDALLNQIGGGIFAAPTLVDRSQGELSPTGNNLDVALQGAGYYGVKQGGQVHLTRNGQFILDSTGRLVMSTNPNQVVLDNNQNPIQLKSLLPVSIDEQGVISQGADKVAKIGVFDVADPAKLHKEGGTLMSVPAGVTLRGGDATLRNGFVERSNVEPATELTKLMESQRQLEANANMIKYQDETLDRLMNDVGKIS